MRPARLRGWPSAARGAHRPARRPADRRAAGPDRATAPVTGGWRPSPRWTVWPAERRPARRRRPTPSTRRRGAESGRQPRSAGERFRIPAKTQWVVAPTAPFPVAECCGLHGETGQSPCSVRALTASNRFGADGTGELQAAVGTEWQQRPDEWSPLRFLRARPATVAAFSQSDLAAESNPLAIVSTNSKPLLRAWGGEGRCQQAQQAQRQLRRRPK